MLWHIYVALLPAGSIHEFPIAHASGLTLSLPLNRPSGFPIYVAASQRAPFPSMSSTPVNSIVEDLEAALSQFAAIAADLKK